MGSFDSLRTTLYEIQLVQNNKRNASSIDRGCSILAKHFEEKINAPADEFPLRLGPAPWTTFERASHEHST
jgi:hypothetical protein